MMVTLVVYKHSLVPSLIGSLPPTTRAKVTALTCGYNDDGMTEEAANNLVSTFESKALANLETFEVYFIDNGGGGSSNNKKPKGKNAYRNAVSALMRSLVHLPHLSCLGLGMTGRRWEDDINGYNVPQWVSAISQVVRSPPPGFPHITELRLLTAGWQSGDEDGRGAKALKGLIRELEGSHLALSLQSLYLRPILSIGWPRAFPNLKKLEVHGVEYGCSWRALELLKRLEKGCCPHLTHLEMRRDAFPAYRNHLAPRTAPIMPPVFISPVIQNLEVLIIGPGMNHMGYTNHFALFKDVWKVIFTITLKQFYHFPLPPLCTTMIITIPSQNRPTLSSFICHSHNLLL